MIHTHRCHCGSERKESASAASGHSIPAASSGVRTRFAKDTISSTSFLLALLVPKCPLCVAAWAAAMGAGAAVQHSLGAAFAPGPRLLWVGLLALPLTLQLALFASARLRRTAAGRGPSRRAKQNDLLQAATAAPENR